MQDVRFIVSAGKFKQGFCPKTYDDLLSSIVEQLAVTPNQDYSTFVQGNVMPTSNEGPWLKDGIEWWVFRNETGTYEPMTFSTLQGFVDIGTLIWWSGTIANYSLYWDSSRWIHCDGRALNRVTYSDLFARIGIGWGVGDGVTTFNIPDQRDSMIAGASADSGGAAMTKMGDGTALLKSRTYQEHWHDGIPGDPSGTSDGLEIGDSFTGPPVAITSTNVSHDYIRVLPPYNAWVPLYRVR